MPLEVNACDVGPESHIYSGKMTNMSISLSCSGECIGLLIGQSEGWRESVFFGVLLKVADNSISSFKINNINLQMCA